MWHLAEGNFVLIPTPNSTQWLCLTWTEPKRSVLTWTKPERSAGYKQLARNLEISAVCAVVCSPPVLSLSSVCSSLVFCPAPTCSVQSNTRHDAVVSSGEGPYGHSWGTEDSTNLPNSWVPLSTSREAEVLQQLLAPTCTSLKMMLAWGLQWCLMQTSGE